eukprot:CAMPEP_0177195400 /NCGR_PEP_ID=MMETSP0367-20130122/23497_1 /TAXON_ID=447022 ORGANISM="Scrippsiella hangoei-like, Strain SHHI-4" /NCGR_SAMPLE_ID=MMETSP0367 /ASSEMBLY_ACC=CAM_ASM_000362 /LENGTH=184 /DNA_ID=CAMNT_0018643433 /DNA_START=27 /DNA_END=578 /DNA_ORIENTATION=+
MHARPLAACLRVHLRRPGPPPTEPRPSPGARRGGSSGPALHLGLVLRVQPVQVLILLLFERVVFVCLVDKVHDVVRRDLLGSHRRVVRQDHAFVHQPEGLDGSLEHQGDLCSDLDDILLGVAQHEDRAALPLYSQVHGVLSSPRNGRRHRHKGRGPARRKVHVRDSKGVSEGRADRPCSRSWFL